MSESKTAQNYSQRLNFINFVFLITEDTSRGFFCRLKTIFLPARGKKKLRQKNIRGKLNFLTLLSEKKQNTIIDTLRGGEIVRNKADANSRVEGRCMMKTSTKETSVVEVFRERNSNGTRCLTC